MSKFCAIPWSHLQVDPNGGVRPCCIMQADSSTILGNIADTSLEELWNTEQMKSLRKNLLSGTRDDRCKVCNELDDANLGSFRQGYQTHIAPTFPGIPNAIKNTSPDGTCNTFNLEYWDFRFSNFCNYKCRSCGPGYSSSWHADAVELGWITEPKTAKPITWLSTTDSRIQLLEKHIGIVKEIYFAGGEPLLMEEHTKVLDLLLAAGRTDVRLRYNTNLSTLKYKQYDLIDDYWSKFKNVEISGSIDAMGPRAEYIRSGTNWDVVDKNIRRLVSALGDSISILTFNVTISSLNVMYLEELLDYFISVNAIKDLTQYNKRPWQFWFNPVFTPEYLCIKNMPQSAKDEVKVIFNNFDERLKKERGINYSFFTDLYPILDQEADPAKMEQFKTMTTKLDELRNESAADVIPELWRHYVEAN